MNEHQAFSRLTESLKAAESDCHTIAKLRDDIRWLEIAARLNGFREMIYKLVGTGEVKH